MAKQKQKSNKTVIYLIVAIVALLVLVVVARAAGLIGNGNELEVELAKTKRTTIVEKVSASGTVQPVTEVKIAPEVSGEIIDLLVEEGDSVKKSAPLVKIRQDIWESQVDRAEAGLSQQRANLEQAKAGLSRSQAQYLRSESEYKRQERLFN